MAETLEFLVEEEEEDRLDRWLAERVEERTRSQVQQDLLAGCVTVNGHPRPARYRLRAGDRIQYVVPDPPVGRVEPEDIPLTIVHEDAHLIVVDKPAGLVVHPAPGHESGTLANALLHHCGPSLRGVGGGGRWGIVHRLDQLTSGLLVAAKTPAAYHSLTAALAERTISRRYVALVIGTMRENEGTVDRPVGRRPNDRKRMGVIEGGREARTDWRVLWQQDGMALLGLALHSGRTHQIRVHMQSIGRPVVGDPEYGWTKEQTLAAAAGPVRARLAAVWPERQLLHAARLTLQHPLESGRTLDFRSPLPAEMVAVIEALWPGGRWQAGVERWQTE